MSFFAGPTYLTLPRTGGAWIIEDLLPVGGLLSVYGKPKVGKSYLALQLAHAISNDAETEVLGFPIRLHGPVAYLQIDTPRGVWCERLESIRATGYGFERVLFADAELVPYPFNIMGEGMGWLQMTLRQIAPFPMVTVVDTLREVHSGDENDSGYMRNVINLLVDACRPSALILLSHARKEQGDASDLMDDIRGSSYLSGRMDCVLKVQETSLVYQGRTVGQARLQIARDPESGFFLMNDDFDKGAREVIRENPKLTTMEKSRVLQSRYPKKSLEACRSIIRRLDPGGPVSSPRTRTIASD